MTINIYEIESSAIYRNSNGTCSDVCDHLNQKVKSCKKFGKELKSAVDFKFCSCCDECNTVVKGLTPETIEE
jgi:hypothetical protein